MDLIPNEMKKRNLSQAFLLLFIALCFQSCGSSIESDAEKMVQLQCDQMKITMGGVTGALSGEMDLSKIQEHQKKVQQFSLKMMNKYDNPAEQQKFAGLVSDRLLNSCL